jgi:hypothetical protein
MENRPYVNVFQDVHKKIQDKKDELRGAQEARTGIHRDDTEKEVVDKGFDRPAMGGPNSTEKITQ